MFSLPLWFILAVITGLASVCFNFINRVVLKDGDDPTAYAWYTEFLRFFVFGILVFFDWHIILTPYSILLFVLLGLTELFSVYWYMKMHAYSHLSISAIISRTRLIWVPLLAFFLVNEQLHLPDYIGILIIFVGISVTMAPKKMFIDKGALYANLSAFMIALNIVIAKMLLPYGSNAVINFTLVLPSVFLFPLLMKNPQARIKTLLKTNLGLKTLAVSFSIVVLFLFVVALRHGDASKINAVYQSMMVFTVLAGIIFLKEREHIVKKLIGATVTIVGVVLLSFS
ncbi:MAG TPA: DMT family transporter [Patescibacteria group bacterium]|nr:DMT family transporter [Patescibacteria group bacterium]